MTQQTPASPEEVAGLLGEVDPSYVDRVVDTGASLDEIGEAIDELEQRKTASQPMPTSARVLAVRRILEELVRVNRAPSVFGHPI